MATRSTSLSTPRSSQPAGAWVPLLRSWAPGLLLCAAIAGIAYSLSIRAGLARWGLGPLTLALLLGVVAGNLHAMRNASALSPGIGLAKQRALRCGVILYGFRLTWQDVGHVGWAGLALDVAVVASTLALAAWVGRRWLRLPSSSALLIGAGSAICGAAAVLATQPVVRGRDEEATVAVATVVLFGTLGVFLYPLLHAVAGAWWPAGSFGLYVGSTVHEVAQVLAIGASLGPGVEQAALIAKMLRVLLLVPVLLALGTMWNAKGKASGHDAAWQALPWFAIGFGAVVALNSVLAVPPAWRAAAAALDTALLATAMAALGTTARWQALHRAGARPLALGLVLFAWLVVAGGAANLLAAHWSR